MSALFKAITAEDDQEFLTTVTTDRIVRPDRPLHAFGDAAQDLIAALVTVANAPFANKRARDIPLPKKAKAPPQNPEMNLQTYPYWFESDCLSERNAASLVAEHRHYDRKDKDEGGSAGHCVRVAAIPNKGGLDVDDCAGQQNSTLIAETG